MASNSDHTGRPVAADLNEIASRFEAYRLARNITQVQLAERAGISRSTLARLETTGGATLETVQRVLRALDIPDRFFLLVPEARQSPLDPLAGERQRARQKTGPLPASRRRWGDER